MNTHAMSVKLPGLRNHQPAASFAEASSIYRARVRALEERGEGGARNTPDGIIYDQTGRIAARISYNGTIWEPGPWKPGAAPLFNPATTADRVRAYFDRLAAASRDDLADIRQVLADRARERAKENAEEQADDLDPCPLCGEPDCTGDYSGGETCLAAPDLGGITSTGHVRPLQVGKAERGGWMIKPYPGQVVADFLDRAEAARAAAAWNYTLRLTLGEMRAAFEAGKIPKAADEPDLAEALRGYYLAYGNCGSPAQQAAAEKARAALEKAGVSV